MKRIILIVLMLVSVVSGARYTIIGDSKAVSSTVWDTMMVRVGGTSSYVNHAVSGYGWFDFDKFNDVTSKTHLLEAYITADNADYAIVEIGVNNIWDAPHPYTPQEDLQALERFKKIAVAMGKNLIVGDILPFWWTNIADTNTRRAQLNQAIYKNSLRKQWCADNNVLFAEGFDDFADPNNGNKMLAAYDTGDGLHLTNAGSQLLGRVYAAATVPTIIHNYKKKTYNITVTSTDSTVLHYIKLDKIADTTFWDNAAYNGRNLSIYVNGIKTKRKIDNLNPYGRTGLLMFPARNTAKVQIKLNYDTSETYDSTVYTDAGLIRRYTLDGPLSTPTFIDAVKGRNGSAVTSMNTYYNSAGLAYTKIQNECIYLQSASPLQTPTLSELSGSNKAVFSHWIYPSASFGWATLRIVMGCGTSSTALTRMDYSTAVNIYIANGSTQSWSISVADFTRAFTLGQWNRVTVIYDLAQGTAQQRVKLIVNGVNLSQYGTTAGLPITLPTFTDNFLLAGNYTGSYTPNVGMDEVTVSSNIMTPNDAIVQYNEQTASSVTVQSVSSTTGSRRSGNRQSNMGMGMH